MEGRRREFTNPLMAQWKNSITAPTSSNLYNNPTTSKKEQREGGGTWNEVKLGGLCPHTERKKLHSRKRKACEVGGATGISWGGSY